MRFSIATVCLSGLLTEKVHAIAAAGFHGIELFENDLLMFDGAVSDVRNLLVDHALELIAYQPFRDFEGLPEPERTRAFDRARRKLDLASTLGCPLLMVCSTTSPRALGGIDRAADDFARLGEYAAEHGIRIAYEALSWGRHVNDYRDSWEIVRRADHEAVGLCLDTFHIFSRETDLGALSTIPGDRIFLVQIADAPRLAMDKLSWSRHYRCFPGQGELPLDAFMRHLSDTRYDGPLSLEIFNDQFRAGSVERTAADGYRSLVYLTERTETPAPAALPPARSPADLAFIEFAIDPASRAPFQNLLLALGFTRTGTHRTKAVEHWSQQSVHFVLNFEDNSFADAYYRAHGSSVCAIALLLDDVDATVERARALNYAAFYGDPRNDTHGNPAIAGLSEGLLYFVSPATPSIWERDFVTVDEANDAFAFLERIDHLSVALSYEDMLRAMLLYRAMFSMRASTSIDVFDPGGLMRSQVMCTEDRSVCIALNSSEAAKTLSSRLAAQQSGGGVQHIALASRDIVRTVERLHHHDIETLRLPGNYYDDLAARFDIDDDELQRMSTLGILYDEDEHGTFMQAYTHYFDRRFCFEIVQRNGYRGFGAANAPIRSAMQTLEISN